jgi:hypothetical protein
MQNAKALITSTSIASLHMTNKPECISIISALIRMKTVIWVTQKIDFIRILILVKYPNRNRILQLIGNTSGQNS